MLPGGVRGHRDPDIPCKDRMYAVTAYIQVPDMTSGRRFFVVGRLLRCAHEHLAIARLDGNHVSDVTCYPYMPYAPGRRRSYAHCNIARPSVFNNTSSI